MGQYPFDSASWQRALVTTTGDVYFVDSTAASKADNPANGMRPETPFATLAYAVGRVTASKGDLIFVAPGHTESITAAGTITLSKANTTIIGLGQGNARPTFTFTTATTATLLVSAANCSIHNCVFDCTGFDAVAGPIAVQAADFTFGHPVIGGNRVILAGATNQATYGILSTAAGTRMRIEENIFAGTSDAGCTAAIGIVGGDGHLIKRNMIIGAFSSGVGGIQNVTTACTNTWVIENTINNLTGSCTKAMVFVTGATGHIARNNMQILSGTAPITGDAMSWSGGNYYAATIAAAGTLI